MESPVTISKRCYLFVSLTFLLSWSLAGAFYLAGGSWNSPAAYVVAILYMFIPMLVVIGLQKLVFHEPVRRKYDVRLRWNRWMLLAWVLPVGIAILAFLVSLGFPGVSFSPGMQGMFDRYASMMNAEQLAELESQMDSFPIHPFWIAMVQALVAGITINAVAAFGEELGWRGLLLDELGHLSFWQASVAIGIIWGLWHAPLILQGHNYPQHPVIGVFMMTAWTIPLSVLFNYVRIRSGTVLSAAVMHGSVNASAGLAIILVAGGSDLTTGITGMAGFIALALCLGMLLVYDFYLAGSSILKTRTVSEAMALAGS